MPIIRKPTNVVKPTPIRNDHNNNGTVTPTSASSSRSRAPPPVSTSASAASTPRTPLSGTSSISPRVRSRILGVAQRTPPNASPPTTPAAAPTETSSYAASRRNRLTLIASRRRGGINSTSRESEETSRELNFDSPNHNLDQEPSSTSNNSSRPQRISLISYTSSLLNRRRDVSSSRSPSRRLSSGRNKMSFQNLLQGATTKVLEGSDKYLPKIFRFLNWNELLPMRCVCKKWLEVVSTNPFVAKGLGTIVIKNNYWEDQLQLFNESPVIWTKFRFEANIFIDLMDTIQLQFWMKHGPLMQSLEIKNKSMTLTGLVEVLSRCHNLSRFLVRWTPEMYSFNAELIKKYYGVNFYNGTFANMREFSVERSCYLNDSALMSLLKWCGGNLKSLSLTYPPEDEQDPLTRLKPRWTIQPLKNYIDRFGYTGNIRKLDFSWSNLTGHDIELLADIQNLSSLKEITLKHCKLDDKSVTNFLVKKGAQLEMLDVEEVPLTDAIFGASSEVKQVSVPRLKSLNISGTLGKYQHFSTTLNQLQCLTELYAANTTWMEYSKLMSSLKKHNILKTVDISGGLKVDGAKQIDVNMNRLWFTNLANTLSQVVKLNLSQWGQFGRNDNFKTICQTMTCLEELRLRGWKDLNDSGVTGIQADTLHNQTFMDNFKENSERVFVGSLKNLHTLDLSHCNVSDATIKYGINCLLYLRKFAFENTQISDTGINYIVTENKTLDQITIAGCEKIARKKLKYQRDDGRFILVGKI